MLLVKQPLVKEKPHQIPSARMAGIDQFWSGRDIAEGFALANEKGYAGHCHIGE
jgi:hypothetical protein